MKQANVTYFHPLQDRICEILLPSQVLQDRIRQVAQQISADYAGQEVILLCVLKGAMMFTADLMRHLEPHVILDFVAVSSYGSATSTSGVVRIQKDVEEKIAGRHVLVVEDIVDTGLTLHYLLANLRLRNPASLKVCCLLDKPARRQVEVDVDYLGFAIEDRFVVGYGLDFDERFRNLSYIGILEEDFA
ncbi:MAG: hypoxanthine phosphoribosyltransferase [Candidatus Xenobium sp.]